MAEGTPPAASHKLFAHMMRDIMSGGQTQDPVDQVPSEAPLSCSVSRCLALR
jgi:hypothetical protein